MKTTAKAKQTKAIKKTTLPVSTIAVRESSADYGRKIKIEHSRICSCGPTHLNCMEAKEWLKSQLGVWRFTYEGRDIRDKTLHPATFPISLIVDPNLRTIV